MEHVGDTCQLDIDFRSKHPLTTISIYLNRSK